MRRRAFTLVELLVVIAIISLLISILAPSLNVAKEIAKQVVCSSNVNAAAKSIHLYCNDNDDKYGPWRSLWSNGRPKAECMPNAEKTFQIAKQGDVDPMTLKQRWRGVGFVYGTGFMESPNYLFCPAQTTPWFIRESYEGDARPSSPQIKPWGYKSSITDMIRTGYLWNAWGKRYPGAVDMFGGNWDLAFKTLSSMEPDKPLVIDHPIFPWLMQVHKARGYENPTFNVAFGDGHVESFSPSSVYVELLINNCGQGGSILQNWAEVPGESPPNDWHEAFYFMARS